MKKKMMAAILVVVLVFSLTGCMETTVEEKISKSGNYTCTMALYIEKEAVVDYVKRKLGTDYVAELNKDMQEEGFTLQTIDGKEYYVSKPEVEKSTIAKLAKTNQQDAIKGSYQMWETGLYMNIKAMGGEALGSMNNISSTSSLALGNTDKETEELLAKSYLIYSVVFDYDIVKTDKNGVIDAGNPKKASWKIKMNSLDSIPTIEAYCKSDIKVSGVTQGATYNKTKKVTFSGTSSASYKGKKVKSGTAFKKHGQHTIILKAASGEQRTVTFFIDKKKPVIKGVKNKKTYKKTKYITVSDKDSGVASLKIDGKKQDLSDGMFAIKKKGKHTIVAKDKVGNVTKIKVTIKKSKKKKKK